MLNVFQCYVLWSIKVHGLDYDFTIDRNFYQYQMPYLMHFALNFILFIFHIAFLFLLVRIFLICLCFRFNRVWGRWHKVCRNGWNRVLHRLFCSCLFSLEIQTWTRSMRWRESHLHSPGCSGPVLLAKQTTHSPRHLQRRPVRNCGAGSVPEDRRGVCALPLLRRGRMQILKR